uniref:Uncharacterized protein n=1 Tax=Rhizophora mucronata TaxID=61149 RepID=A0A2P2QFH7_RHIMU
MKKRKNKKERNRPTCTEQMLTINAESQQRGIEKHNEGSLPILRMQNAFFQMKNLLFSCKGVSQFSWVKYLNKRHFLLKRGVKQKSSLYHIKPRTK